MAESCITQDLKTFLLNMIDNQRPYETMKVIVEDGFPICSAGMFATPAAAEATKEKKRAMAARWPGAIYINPKGKREEWDSASALYTHLTGKAVSGSICDEAGNTCRAATLLDNFRFHGYTIQGNGEPAPESDPEAVAATKKAHEDWKQHLLATGKKLVVIDPKAIKKVQQE